MGEQTGISWTHHTFNPWWGCQRVSPGCENCYAEANDKFYCASDPHWGPEAPRRFFGDKHWEEPLKWDAKARKVDERRRVFCASMADVLEDRPGLMEPRHRLFKLIRRTQQLDYLLLTKRPENYERMLPWTIGTRNGHDTCDLDVCKAAMLDDVCCPPDSCDIADRVRACDPWANVWLGTTGEDDKWMQRRAEYIRRIIAAVKFISYEPALGPVNWDAVLGPGGIDWVIVGGESGFGGRTREFQIEWAEQALAACQKYGVAFFMKQLGRFPRKNGQLIPLRLDKRAGAKLEEIPTHLQLRQIPIARAA